MGKKIISLLLVLFISFALIPSINVKALESQATLKNGDFEEDGLSGWGKSSTNSNLKVELTSETAQSGENSVKFSNLSESAYLGDLSRNITLSEAQGKLLSLNYYLKTIDYTGEFQIRTIYYNNENEKVLDEVTNVLSIRENSDWYLKNTKIQIPNDSSIAYVKVKFVYYYAKGTVYVDNISASVEENGEENVFVKNGSFENDFGGVWEKSSSDSSLKVKVTDEDSYDGNISLKFENTADKGILGVVRQKVDLKDAAGMAIKLKFWTKSSNFSGNIQIRTTYYDAEGVKVGELLRNDVGIQSNSEWEEKETSIDIYNEQSISTAVIEIAYNYAKGTIYLDNITGEIVENIEASRVIKNGSFESGALKWNDWKTTDNFNWEIDNTVVKDGKASAKMYSTDENNASGGLIQITSLPEEYIGQKVKVGQWIKTSGLKGTALRITLSFCDENDKEVSFREMKSLGVAPNSEWQYLETIMQIPQSQDIKKIKLAYSFEKNVGTVWIDDIILEKTEDNEESNIALNGGFESTIASPASEWIYDYSYDGLKYEIDGNTKIEGKNSLKITSTSFEKSSKVSNYIQISSDALGKSFKISEQVKADSEARVFVTLKYLAQNSEVLGSEMWTYKVKAGDWIENTKIANVPNNSNIKAILIEYRVSGIIGNFWIDDVRIESFKEISTIKSEPSLIKLNIGEKKALSLKIEPSDASHQDLDIKSDNTDIAQVNEANEIIGINSGVTIIKLAEKYTNKVYEIPVVVGESSIDLTNIISLTGKKGEFVTGKVDINSENNNFTYSILTEGTEGNLYLNEDGTFKYYINKDAANYGEFAIKVQDEIGNEEVVQYIINISEEDKEIEAEDKVISLDENTEALGNLEFGENITYSKVSDVSNGILTISETGEYSYTPNKDYSGYDKSEIKLVNSEGKTKNITLIFNIVLSKDKIKDKLLNINHPQIMYNNEDFERVKNLIETDSKFKEVFENVKLRLDKMLTQDVIEYNKNSIELNTASKDIIIDLIIMYKITNEEKYAERALKEIKNICSYPDWNEDNNFLNAADLSLAASFGYDMLYDYLTEEDKSLIKDTIITRGLNKEAELLEQGSWYDYEESNIGIITHLSMLFASFSIADNDNIELTSDISSKVLKIIPNILNMYYKDGSNQEGPMYWLYSMESLMCGHTAIENVLGINRPFSEVLNLSKLEEYELYSVSKNGSFSYADSEANLLASYPSVWLSNLNNSTTGMKYFDWMFNTSLYAKGYDLMWYRTDLYNASLETDFNLDKYFDRTQVVTMKSDFKSNGIFASLKGGTTGVNHGDLDIGTFVYDNLGIRWAVDLGAEKYSLYGIGVNGQGGVRWRYYRKRAEGHNTLIIGDSVNEDQVVGSTSKIIETDLNGESPYAILDMTEAYKDKANSVIRKMELKNRNDFVIEDNFLLKKEEDVTWQMHTEADIEIINDNMAILTKDGRSVTVLLSSDCNAKFEIKDAVPDENSPLVASQTANTGIKKLVAKATCRSGNIKVEISTSQDRKPVIDDFISDKASPQIKETKITLTAKASGIGTLQYRFTLNDSQNNYYVLKDYSLSNVCEWIAGSIGNKTLCVEVKDLEGNVTKKEMPYEIVLPNPPEIESFSADKASPQIKGTKVVLTANASGAGTLKYQFSISDAQNNYYVLSGYSSSNIYEWTTGAIGNKKLYVGVKDVEGQITREEIPYEVILPNPPEIESFSADKVSPQPKGTKVVLTANASGVGTLKYQFSISDAQNNYYVLSGYSSSNVYEWTTGAIGNKTLYVEVKDAEGQITREEILYEVTLPNPPVIESFNTDKVSPQPSKTEITLKAKATGIGTLQYKFLLSDPKSNWYVIQNYSTANTAKWTTGLAGDKTLYVDVKDEDGQVTRKAIAYKVTTSQPPVIESFSVDKASPQPSKTEITLKAQATGEGTLQYKFLVSDPNSNWYVIQNYSTANTAKWTTGLAGNKTLHVDVKDKEGQVTRKSIAYKVTSFQPPVIESFGVDKKSPQTSGTKITLKAQASGTGELQYRFLVSDPQSNWYVIRDYSISNTCVWTTGKIGSKTLYVDVKDKEGQVTRKAIPFVVK